MTSNEEEEERDSDSVEAPDPDFSLAESAQEKGASLAQRAQETAASLAEKAKASAAVGWARAIALGVRDTAKDVIDEGRDGARAKQSQMWDKFDKKTKRRRDK